MDALSVFRMDGSEPRLLGRINLDPVTFSYDPATSPTPTRERSPARSLCETSL